MRSNRSDRDDHRPPGPRQDRNHCKSQAVRSEGQRWRVKVEDKKRGPDAQDRTPPPQSSERTPPNARQDAPNYETSDKGQAVRVEDLSSAVDEGAN